MLTRTLIQGWIAKSRPGGPKKLPSNANATSRLITLPRGWDSQGERTVSDAPIRVQCAYRNSVITRFAVEFAKENLLFLIATLPLYLCIYILVLHTASKSPECLDRSQNTPAAFLEQSQQTSMHFHIHPPKAYIGRGARILLKDGPFVQCSLAQWL